MRNDFHAELDSLTGSLSQMCGLAGLAMERATQSLLQADLVLAEQVITDHEHLTRMQLHAEEASLLLLALQAPVAGDLRVVVTSMQNVADAERMGGLALHVAKIARRRHPEPRPARGGERLLRRNGPHRRRSRQQRQGRGAVARPRAGRADQPRRRGHGPASPASVHHDDGHGSGATASRLP